MSPSVMSKQATLNIGTIGHVAHGKSTIVRAISGISTIKFQAELERNITIKLGYANAKIFRCNECPRPFCYSSYSSNVPDILTCDRCGSPTYLVRHVSFVDCPGHDVLMATMLNGTAIMDAALLLIAANEPCPQPQTIEHLYAVEIMNLDKIIVVQNKIDLVSREQAIEQHDQIQTFLAKSNVFASVVPTAGQLKINICAVLDFIVNCIPEPRRDRAANTKMVVIRSFDVNRPGTKILELQGGVIGGSLVSGILKIGDEIEIRPGQFSKKNGRFITKPFITTIMSLKAEANELEEAVPGGLIGVGTTMDPVFCKADKLVGQVMGSFGLLPPVYSKIEVDYKLFSKNIDHDLATMNEHEQILINIGSTTTGGQIRGVEDTHLFVDLFRPACCEIGEKIAISKKIDKHWRLVGFGEILGGEIVELDYSMNATE